MALGQSIRIYLADGSLGGIRHGEIINWTGQSIACSRLRLNELKEWDELERPGVYFLFGQDEKSLQDSVYIGESENVLRRISQHFTPTEAFWTECVAFTNKDDNLTKVHVRYLESRLIALADTAKRHVIENTVRPAKPRLPMADCDTMEEFINKLRILLGVLGYRVLDPLVTCTSAQESVGGIALPLAATELPTQPMVGDQAQQKSPIFQIYAANITARAMSTGEGVVVLAGSEASACDQASLAAGYRRLREQMIALGILVQIENGKKLTFTRAHLFRSPSAAACCVIGSAVNGRTYWRTSSGETFDAFEKRFTRDIDTESVVQGEQDCTVVKVEQNDINQVD